MKMNLSTTVLSTALTLIVLAGADCGMPIAGNIVPLTNGCGTRVAAGGRTLIIPCNWTQTNEFTPSGLAEFEALFLYDFNNIRRAQVVVADMTDGDPLVPSGTSIGNEQMFTNSFGVDLSIGSASINNVLAWLVFVEIENNQFLGVLVLGLPEDSAANELVAFSIANSIRPAG